MPSIQAHLECFGSLNLNQASSILVLNLGLHLVVLKPSGMIGVFDFHDQSGRAG